MFVLIENNERYGAKGRTISNHEYNRLPIADQKMFKRWVVGENLQSLAPNVSLKGGAGEVSKKLKV
jgi:hypothetical protein